MSNNIERMKKIIEEKKAVSSHQGSGSNDRRMNKTIGTSMKGFKSRKQGGVFDK